VLDDDDPVLSQFPDALINQRWLAAAG